VRRLLYTELQIGHSDADSLGDERDRTRSSAGKDAPSQSPSHTSLASAYASFLPSRAYLGYLARLLLLVVSFAGDMLGVYTAL